ncbi:hypothetical protein BGY98DRAFT_938073 [Russula aff. rugulosa BPL654]|nr:hypothetical protein BGY98DRAFT_938073 [Russula aff. rugulosa BPL654]
MHRLLFTDTSLYLRLLSIRQISGVCLDPEHLRSTLPEWSVFPSHRTSGACTFPLLPLTRCLAGDDQGVTTPRVSCTRSSSIRGPDIRGVHPDVSGTTSVYSGSKDGGQGNDECDLALIASSADPYDNGPQCLAARWIRHVRRIAGQVWSVYLFIWKDRPDTSFKIDAVSQAAAMTHFSTSVLGVFFPRSRDVDNLRTDHHLPGSRNEERIGKPSCVLPGPVLLSPPATAA